MPIMTVTEKNREHMFRTASDILERGGVIAFPTESFYALGVLATHETAVKKLFALKERPADKPLPIIVGGMDLLLSMVKNISDQAMELIEKYWPGPLTLIFESRDVVPAVLTGGSGKVAVRIPGESIALDIVKSLSVPLTATSANPSSCRPAVTAEEVMRYFGDRVDLIINGGEAPGGRPSTIADVTKVPFETMRQGRVLLD